MRYLCSWEAIAYYFLIIDLYWKIIGFCGGSVVKNRPAKQKMCVQSLDQEGPLKKEMATHSSILAWQITWIEELGGLQPMGLQRVGHNLATKQQLQSLNFTLSLFQKKGANILIKHHIYIILYFPNIFSPIILLMQFYCVIIITAFIYTCESDVLRSWCSKYGLRIQQHHQMSLLEMQNHHPRPTELQYY